MRKATCLLLSLLIFATPLFAIKEAIYNAQGVKVGYIEKVNGKTIYYDRNGFTTDRVDMQTLINQELDNIERNKRAFELSEEEKRKNKELEDDMVAVLQNNPELTLWLAKWMLIILGILLLKGCIDGEFDNAICSPK